MFIRSQGRTELIDITGKRLYVWSEISGITRIYVDLLYNEDAYVELGKYESKERATQILDQMQKQLNLCTGYVIHKPHIGDALYNEIKSEIVFQMPEE